MEVYIKFVNEITTMLIETTYLYVCELCLLLIDVIRLNITSATTSNTAMSSAVKLVNFRNRLIDIAQVR